MPISISPNTPNEFAESEVSEAQAFDTALSVKFAKIVALFLRSDRHNSLPISALDRLVLPPLFADQFAMYEGRYDNGGPVPQPLAVALWAQVSSEVDRRLTASAKGTLDLEPEEWTSGDIPWIIDIVGPSELTDAFLSELSRKIFPDQHPKIRIVDNHGRSTVTALGAAV